MESARLAEAVQTTTNNKDLASVQTQLTAITEMVKGLTSNQPVRSVTPPKHVSWQERPRSPSPRPRQQQPTYNQNSNYRNNYNRTYTSSQSQQPNTQRSQSPNPTPLRDTVTSCGRCGISHPPQACPAFGKQCHKCGKFGHFSRKCHSSPTRHTTTKSTIGTRP